MCGWFGVMSSVPTCDCDAAAISRPVAVGKGNCVGPAAAIWACVATAGQEWTGGGKPRSVRPPLLLFVQAAFRRGSSREQQQEQKQQQQSAGAPGHLVLPPILLIFLLFPPPQRPVVPTNLENLRSTAPLPVSHSASVPS
jgi:hypothetical protein